MTIPNRHSILLSIISALYSAPQAIDFWRLIFFFVNLVIHEMAHETLYIPGDTELNENLATFIGDWGTLLYLEKEYGLGYLFCD